MECKLTITGTFADIQQALSLLQGGNPTETIVQTFTPENYRHDPPADYTVKAIDLKREETKANGATLNPDLPVESMQRVEKSVEKSVEPRKKPGLKPGPRPDPVAVKQVAPVIPAVPDERHCHTCGKLFIPPRPTSHHCSKQCYMVEWRDKNKPPKVAAPDAKKIEDATEHLDRKLDEIRKTHPAPKPRPNIQHDF
jgi:hypothetical protein